MNISLDYDDTFTVYPDMWLKVAKMFQLHGCKVYGVTYRGEGKVSDKYKEACNGGIYFTGGESKRKYMSDKGIRIDIWIDDMAKL